MGFFDAIFGDGGAKEAAAAQTAGINKGKKSAFSQLEQGLAGATGQYNAGLDRFSPYAQTGLAANTLYGNALGLNGADGTMAAQGAYQASPGYQFQLDQGNQALMRTAAARGALGGGGLNADILKFSQGLAAQDYGGWLDRLQGLQSQGVGVAGAQAGINTGLGDLIYGTGQNKAQIGWNAATGKGNAEANGILTGNQNIFNKVMGGLQLGASLLGAL